MYGMNNNFNPRGITTNQMFNNKFSNYNSGFVPQRELISEPDYTNRGGVLHNNLGENLMNQDVEEYSIYIDSNDRDINIYPNPFSFSVRFGDNHKKNEKGPHIDIDFKNVKYIRLDSIILPRFIYNDSYTLNDEKLTDWRYVSMNIDELNTGDSKIYSTSNSNPNKNSSRAFSYIYPDKWINRGHYLGYVNGGSRIYKYSNLGNIKKLTFTFSDDNGNEIKPNINLNSNDMQDDDHPLNPDRQLFMSFKIGVVESQLNTNTQFAS